MTLKQYNELNPNDQADALKVINSKNSLLEWEAAIYLGMCLRSLQELRLKRLIPYIPKGSRGITYRRADLDKYQADNLVRAAV